jgi:hypothetical protein
MTNRITRCGPEGKRRREASASWPFAFLALPPHRGRARRRNTGGTRSIKGSAPRGRATVAQVNFDAVCYSTEKLGSHLQGVRVECEYAEGGSRA